MRNDAPVAGSHICAESGDLEPQVAEAEGGEAVNDE
jgi:hypothetical protein